MPPAGNLLTAVHLEQILSLLLDAGFTAGYDGATALDKGISILLPGLAARPAPPAASART